MCYIINLLPLSLSNRGIPVGLYTQSTAEACKYIADDCKANIIVVDNEQQMLKILSVSVYSKLLKSSSCDDTVLELDIEK